MDRTTQMVSGLRDPEFVGVGFVVIREIRSWTAFRRRKSESEICA